MDDLFIIQGYFTNNDNVNMQELAKMLIFIGADVKLTN